MACCVNSMVVGTTFNKLHYRSIAQRALLLILINLNAPKMSRTFSAGINLNELHSLSNLLVIA